MIFDLAALDRLVERASLALLDGSGELLDGIYREAARQSTFEELEAMPHPLAPHVAHLTIARVSGSALETAMTTPSTPARDLPRAVTSGPLVSLHGAVLEAAAASSLEAARAWLAVAEAAATKPSDEAKTQAEIAEEAARRLRVARDPALAPEASAFLDQTSELARSFAKELGAIAIVAGARAAGEGWPRRPTVEFAIEAFGADVKARRTIARIAERARAKKETIVLGASSHMRAIAAFAFEWHARAPARVPFAERHDPEWTGAHGSALLVASALATTHFQKRSLGLGERVARAQARALDASGLFSARMAAARILVRDADFGERVFGRAIDPKLARVLPRPRRDAHGRFRAWLDLPSLLESAQSTHDEDWFRNPRFWEEMAIRFVSPKTVPAKTAHARALSAIFTERLA